MAGLSLSLESGWTLQLEDGRLEVSPSSTCMSKRPMHAAGALS
jgi:hypothetical protein